MLELFCGTKSVGDIFSSSGYDVISLDYNKKFNATHTEDILKWDYRQYPSGYFDVIWASPDCTTWSIATGGKYRTKASIYGLNNQHQAQASLGNEMVLRVMEIITYFQPKAWFIENPKGLLKYFPPLVQYIDCVGANMNLIYYGNYNWGFPKPTNIWSNLPLWEDEKIPVMPADTYEIKYRKSKQRNERCYYAFSNGSAKSRSKIPPDLINRLRLLIPDYKN
jgi:hypothetical protein